MVWHAVVFISFTGTCKINSKQVTTATLQDTSSAAPVTGRVLKPILWDVSWHGKLMLCLVGRFHFSNTGPIQDLYTAQAVT